MTRVRNLIEWLQSLDPDDEVISILFDRTDVVLTGGQKLKDEHWLKIVSRVNPDYALESLSENFSEQVYSVMGEFHCENCSEYDYEAKPDEFSGTICRSCGEAEDLVE